jgi:hypothetical protein
VACPGSPGQETEQPGKARLAVDIRGQDVEGSGEEHLLAVRRLVLDPAVADAALDERPWRRDRRRLGGEPIRTLVDHEPLS